MTNATGEPGKPIDITLKGLSDQIHAVDQALERALEILRDVNSDENELAGAVAIIETAREVTSKLDLALYAARMRPEN